MTTRPNINNQIGEDILTILLAGTRTLAVPPVEYVVSSEWQDDPTCVCGNLAYTGGFYACAGPTTHKWVEPTHEAWNGKSVMCNDCGRIFDQTTHDRNPNGSGKDWDTHRMLVTDGPVDGVPPHGETEAESIYNALERYWDGEGES